MKELKVTIITPTFNRAHTLPRAFESLKNQTFKDFKWIIMDDGSTDETKSLVQTFIEESPFEIEYYKNENAKKFYTVFKGIETVKTDYFTILDSDDAYPRNALNFLVNEAEKLEKKEFISVIGHSEDEHGNLVGNLFPKNGFDGSILEIRYKYNVRGDKNGIFITEPYLKYLRNFDFEIYKNQYAPQQIFFNIYDAAGMKTRFINEVVRTYYFDLSDQNSMSNERIKPSSYFGLKNAYLSFLNEYANKLWSYPNLLLKRTIDYQSISILMNDNPIETIQKIKPMSIKTLSIVLYPLSWIYSKLKL